MNTLTQSEIENGFRGIGLHEDMLLEVHGSLSIFGRVEGGANTVIKALMNVIGRSTSEKANACFSR
jgi:aminoglycoside N3'-acetyltransferase